MSTRPHYGQDMYLLSVKLHFEFTKKTISFYTRKTTSSVPTTKHENIYSNIRDRIILHVPRAKQNDLIPNEKVRFPFSVPLSSACAHRLPLGRWRKAGLRGVPPLPFRSQFFLLFSLHTLVSFPRALERVRRNGVWAKDQAHVHLT